MYVSFQCKDDLMKIEWKYRKFLPELLQFEFADSTELFDGTNRCISTKHLILQDHKKK